ncbi:hypothetical protein B0T16DRAFT_180681 [Cercophora newfieldiana]|uniref:Uncharacterized protein n=1 Tax=Cercophora newfieldiana TaxID=92897 RepID=A0AA39XZV2_9PEZI|nr:hypothetical protein B0T16DRAFT_180681 [Cercophora newfieldiana]
MRPPVVSMSQQGDRSIKTVDESPSVQFLPVSNLKAFHYARETIWNGGEVNKRPLSGSLGEPKITTNADLHFAVSGPKSQPRRLSTRQQNLQKKSQHDPPGSKTTKQRSGARYHLQKKYTTLFSLPSSSKTPDRTTSKSILKVCSLPSTTSSARPSAMQFQLTAATVLVGCVSALGTEWEGTPNTSQRGLMEHLVQAVGPERPLHRRAHR